MDEFEILGTRQTVMLNRCWRSIGVTMIGLIAATGLITSAFVAAPVAHAAGSTAGTGATYCHDHGATNAGANYLNVYACNDSTPNSNSYWQCVELAERFIQAELGFPLWHADTGALVVAAGAWSISGQTQWPPAPAHPLPVGKPGPGSLPSPGDLISFTPTSTNASGHVAVVTNVAVSNGTGTITVMEQNYCENGRDSGCNWQDNNGNNTITVSSGNWSMGSQWTSNKDFSWLELGLSTPNDLFFIKTGNVASGHIEVHSATVASSYQTGIDYPTWFSTADALYGWWQMVGSDLYFIKTKNTGSGHIEIHSATAASGYQSGVHIVTWFGVADAGNGPFQMIDGDLYFIKEWNTGSGRIEVHTATAATGYSNGLHEVTGFSPANVNNGWFQMAGTDLYFIDMKNAAFGHIQVQSATSASSYQPGAVYVSRFSAADTSNGWWQIGAKS